jgi:hypothetical protein
MVRLVLRYTALLDLKPGDEGEIKDGRKQIKLIPVGSRARLQVSPPMVSSTS